MALAAIRDDTVVPDFPERAKEIRLVDLSNEVIDALDRRGWLADAKQELSKEVPIPAMWDVANRLTDSANEVIELCLKQNGVDVAQSQSYYATPILPTWRNDDSVDARPVLARFQELLFEELQLQAQHPLVIPKSTDDLERIGTMRDLFSSVFWEEINSRHRRQHGGNWNASKRLAEYLQTVPEHDRRRFVLFSSSSGQTIHGLRAKDTTERWAYYFVHIAAAREQEFMEAFSSNDMDLAAFGTVIISEYEHRFRLRQTEAAGERFRVRLEAYANFAERQRIYSLQSRAKDAVHRSEDFQGMRLEVAMTDSGSRHALAEHLADKVEFEPSFDDAEPFRFVDSFSIGMQGAAATELLNLLLDRSASASELRYIADLLVGNRAFDVEAEFQPIRAAVGILGNSARAFNFVDLFFVGNRGLGGQKRMSLALTSLALFPFSRVAWIPGVVAKLLAPFAKETERRAKEDIAQILSALDRKCAILDLLYRLAGSQREELAQLVMGYCTAESNDPALDRACALIDSILRSCRREKTTILGAENIRRAGIRVERNIVSGLVDLALSKSGDDKNLLFLLEEPFISEVRSLTLLGNVIEEKHSTEKRAVLERLMSGALDTACDAAAYPKDRRQSLLRLIVEELLQHDRAPDGSWVEKVEAERHGRTPRAQIDLPEKAPATWKADKQPGDTPPDFIKRHYGQWLRADGLGLTKADLRRLDFSLYTALANWLSRKNTLPDDCPVPTLAQRNDRELQDFEADRDPAEVARLAMARARRGK